jgi:8-oxo-dGTP pyrophosphatase MutT (NUDIX family)
LPYRFTQHGALEILIVTSRQTRRWIVPKGWPIRGLKPGKSAAREAFEEAGIRGRISTKAIGAFTYKKALDEKDLEVSCEVKVFSLLVSGKRVCGPKQRSARPSGSILQTP